MVEVRKPILVADAVEKVMALKRRGALEEVPLEDCDFRRLGEGLKAAHDVPPFDRSPYDGFALRSRDTKEASSEEPYIFKVVDEIGAGQVSLIHVGEREAVRIMTGAQIPARADCVIMLELVKETSKDGQKMITVEREIAEGENISFQGEDTKKGGLLIEKGTLINPGVKALLATFGYARVKVAKKPVIGVIATGSELLQPDEELVPGKIRNSNGPMIEAQIIRAGGIPKMYAEAADELDALHSVIGKAMDECDFVITTGGVSVGDFDHMPEIFRRIGAESLFNKIAMRPGSVTSCAERDGKLLFGLSGNPSACYVGFELFVRPYIKYWLHSDKPFLKSVKGCLAADFTKPNPFSRFVRAKLRFEDGKILAGPVGLDKPGVVTSLAWADCLLVLAGGTRGYGKGDKVDILLLEDNEGSATPWQEAKDLG